MNFNFRCFTAYCVAQLEHQILYSNVCPTSGAPYKANSNNHQLSYTVSTSCFYLKIKSTEFVLCVKTMTCRGPEIWNEL